MPSKKWLSIHEIAPLFHRPIVDVAATLGVCTTVLKKVCRRHGIRRWPQRKLQSLNKMISNLHEAMQQTDVAEEHQRLACEITNLQTRKVILTAPIARQGAPLEPSGASEEERLAHQDRSGAMDALSHAQLVADHARLQLREGESSASPRHNGKRALSGDNDDGDSDGDGGGDDEEEQAGAPLSLQGAAGEQDESAVGTLLMRMRANGAPPQKRAHVDGAPSTCGPTPPTVATTALPPNHQMAPPAAGGWTLQDRFNTSRVGSGDPHNEHATAAAAASTEVPSAAVEAAAASASQPKQVAPAPGAPGDKLPFAGLEPLSGGQPRAHVPMAQMSMPPMAAMARMAQLPLLTPPMGMGGEPLASPELPAALLPNPLPGAPTTYPSALQQLMHDQMNLQMLLRMNGPSTHAPRTAALAAPAATMAGGGGAVPFSALSPMSSNPTGLSPQASPPLPSPGLMMTPQQLLHAQQMHQLQMQQMQMQHVQLLQAQQMQHMQHSPYAPSMEGARPGGWQPWPDSAPVGRTAFSGNGDGSSACGYGGGSAISCNSSPPLPGGSGAGAPTALTTQQLQHLLPQLQQQQLLQQQLQQLQHLLPQTAEVPQAVRKIKRAALPVSPLPLAQPRPLPRLAPALGGFFHSMNAGAPPHMLHAIPLPAASTSSATAAAPAAAAAAPLAASPAPAAVAAVVPKVIAAEAPPAASRAATQETPKAVFAQSLPVWASPFDAEASATSVGSGALGPSVDDADGDDVSCACARG